MAMSQMEEEEREQSLGTHLLPPCSSPQTQLLLLPCRVKEEEKGVVIFPPLTLPSPLPLSHPHSSPSLPSSPLPTLLPLQLPPSLLPPPHNLPQLCRFEVVTLWQLGAPTQVLVKCIYFDSLLPRVNACVSGFISREREGAFAPPRSLLFAYVIHTEVR